MISPSGRSESLIRPVRDAPAEPAEYPLAAAEPAPDDEAMGWFASSLDLHLGLQVHEEPMETLPAELFDELFRP